MILAMFQRKTTNRISDPGFEDLPPSSRAQILRKIRFPPDVCPLYLGTYIDCAYLFSFLLHELAPFFRGNQVCSGSFYELFKFCTSCAKDISLAMSPIATLA